LVVENTRNRNLVHPLACVANAQQHVSAERHFSDWHCPLPQFGFFGLDQNPAATRHRVARVRDEVDQNLLDLVAIRTDMVDCRIEGSCQLNIRLQQPFEQIGHATGDGADIQQLGLARLPPAEREKLTGQICRMTRSFTDGLGTLAKFRVPASGGENLVAIP
jgi:hypothetical protein